MGRRVVMLRCRFNSCWCRVSDHRLFFDLFNEPRFIVLVLMLLLLHPLTLFVRGGHWLGRVIFFVERFGHFLLVCGGCGSHVLRGRLHPHCRSHRVSAHAAWLAHLAPLGLVFLLQGDATHGLGVN